MAFNPRKLDSVRHCHALMENVKRDFPQLSRAAECRYLSNVCNILFQIQDRQHEKIEKALWQEVKIPPERSAGPAGPQKGPAGGGALLQRLCHDPTGL